MDQAGAQTQSESDLRKIAIQNAVILFVILFVLGGVAGWSLARVPSRPLSSMIWVSVEVIASAWICRTYYATNGLMARRGR
jgi:hypothetical protein